MHKSPSRLIGCLVVTVAVCLWSIESGLVSKSTAAKTEVHAVEVLPTGWRRTVDGWERAESWSLNQVHSVHDINGWIAIEDSQQSNVVSAVLERLHAIHPLGYAAVLAAAVVAIFRVSERRPC